MHYTVAYDPAIESELIDLWIRAPNRRAVATASNDIDRRLKQSPDRSGQAIGAYRRLVVHPLAGEFTVSPLDRMVRVVRVELLP